MRIIKRFLALVYILSIFMGVAHEISHTHHIGENCSVCVLSHTPAVPTDAPSIPLVTHSFTEFTPLTLSQTDPLFIQARSRAPPLL